MNKRFEALDAFRGLCAISVVIFHMHISGSVTEWDFFRGSYLFVEFFFVLSGFVLAHGYGFRPNLKFKPFVKARFFRIFPLHIVMLMVMLILELGKFFAYNFAGMSFNKIPFTGANAINEIIPNLLLIQSWTSFSDPTSFNIPSWSISIEFYMYILLFLSITIFKGNRFIVWLSTSLIALYLLTTQSNIITNEALRGLSCFFGGAFIYFIYKKIETIKINFMLGSLLECFLLISIFIILSSNFEYRTIVAIFTFFITIPIFAFESGVCSYFLKKKPFQTIGHLSFSIYMIHHAFIFILTSYFMVLQKITGLELSIMVNNVRTLTTGNILLNNGLVFIVISLIVLTSHFTYKHIELKWESFGRLKLQRTVQDESSIL
ncbi:acyltransferase family protein [Photobacterium leiognathi]|uniref:acyltransferase family protein n=1 Tax=Photobacterium leiognathi TaxID=553611 RepID=UPI002739D575|nr:acyltransferase [Photobacterium leiognathi]